MKRRIGIFIFAGILCISLLMAYRQYRIEQDNVVYEDENGVTITRIEDEEESAEEYDITKAYYTDYNDDALETYVIANVFGEVDEYIKDLRESDICEYVFENENGKIEVKLTAEQRQKWMNSSVENIQNVLNGIREDALYEYSYAQDYTELYSKIHKDSDAYEYMEDLTLLIYNAEIYQILAGTDKWSVHVVIENMENGKELVNVQYPQEGIDITPDMWD